MPEQRDKRLALKATSHDHGDNKTTDSRKGMNAQYNGPAAHDADLHTKRRSETGQTKRTRCWKPHRIENIRGSPRMLLARARPSQCLHFTSINIDIDHLSSFCLLSLIHWLKISAVSYSIRTLPRWGLPMTMLGYGMLVSYQSFIPSQYHVPAMLCVPSHVYTAGIYCVFCVCFGT